MKDSCSVPLCKSKRGMTPGISFHQFPVTPIREEWITNIHRSMPNKVTKKWSPNDYSLVCSLHFHEADYKEGLKVLRLKPTAVPTVFKDFPVHLQAKIKRNSLKRKLPLTRNSPLKKVKVWVLVQEVVPDAEDNLQNSSLEIQSVTSGKKYRQNKPSLPDT